MTTMDFNLANATAVLERTPATLRAMLGGLPTVWTTANEGPDTWTPFDVVGHLIHGDRVNWIPRARLILDQGPVRRFAPFDRQAMFRDSAGKSLDELLDTFAQLRADNLATLASWDFGERELALEGEHPEFGPITLRQLLSTWVGHDLTHIAQISRVMAKQYRDAVGPWVKFLSIMTTVTHGKD